MTVEPVPDTDAARRRAEGAHWELRRRLERRLHDGPALRISALALQLGLLKQKMPSGEPQLQQDIADLQDELHEVLEELRAVSARIYPPLLYEAGLGPALAELAARTVAPLRISAPAERLDGPVEAVAYFTVLDLLDGAAGIPAEIGIRREDHHVSVQITQVDASHVPAVTDRISALGGTVDEGPSGGMIVRIPCG